MQETVKAGRPSWSSWLLARDGVCCELGPLCPWVLAKLGALLGDAGDQTVTSVGMGLWERQELGPETEHGSQPGAAPSRAGKAAITRSDLGTFSPGSLQLGFQSQPSAHLLWDPGQLTCPSEPPVLLWRQWGHPQKGHTRGESDVSSTSLCSRAPRGPLDRWGTDVDGIKGEGSWAPDQRRGERIGCLPPRGKEEYVLPRCPLVASRPSP